MEAIIPSNPSPFLALPIELRLKIYRLLLKHPAFDKEDAETHIRDALWLRHKTNNWLPPSLCATNRQIRAESLPLFYSENYFHFFWIPSDAQGLAWMEGKLALLAERRVLRMGHLVLWFKHSGLWYDAKSKLWFDPLVKTMDHVARLFRFLCLYVGKDVAGGNGPLEEIVTVRPPWVYAELLDWAKLYHAREIPDDEAAARILRALVKANKATCSARLVMLARSKVGQSKRRRALSNEEEQNRWNGVLRSRKR